MGNWRTVTITGTCPPDQLDALREATNPHAGGEYHNFHCLSTGNGLAGLGNWPAEHIDVSGNLAERDYGVGDVEDTLREIAAKAPGLAVKVHCGDDWESEDCIATVTLENGTVMVGPPEVARVRGASPDEMTGRLFKQLGGHP